MKFHFLLLLFISLLLINVKAHAETENSTESTEDVPKKESPWLLTPTLSSSPKLGNSVGAMGAYLHKFDDKSPTSMMGVMGNYSDTDSSMYGAFSKLYFSEDQHRMKLGVMIGEIENEYEDFLGTGINAITTDNIRVSFLNYTKRLKNDWFVGIQTIGVKYDITAGNQETQDIIDAVGLDTLNSRGIGAVIERDTRDNQNSPQSGSTLTVNNIAFREALGGGEDYDSYMVRYSQYFSHGNGHVIAAQFDGRWTSDAPTSAYSSVDLRGYTRGEYLAPHSITMQVEERYAFNDKWGATAFVGAACLYGDDASCDDTTNWFPSFGAGATYMLKKEERMVVRAEFAIGKNDSRGFYIQFGNAF